jgi:hypothetical protein
VSQRTAYGGAHEFLKLTQCIARPTRGKLRKPEAEAGKRRWLRERSQSRNRADGLTLAKLYEGVSAECRFVTEDSPLHERQTVGHDDRVGERGQDEVVMKATVFGVQAMCRLQRRERPPKVAIAEAGQPEMEGIQRAIRCELDRIRQVLDSARLIGGA